MEFTTSIREITRRKKAFLTLLTSLFIGLVLTSKIFHYPISGSKYLLIIGIFIIIGILTFQFLSSISKVRLFINEEKIERINGKSVDKFLFSNIKIIKIKRRTNGVIREIYILFSDKRSLFLTAFEDDFEDIKDILLDKTNKKISIKEAREPISFDHPIFYPALGLLIGFISILSFRATLNASSYQASFITIICSIYAASVGTYFIFNRPISSRYKDKSAVIDYITGSIFICAGIILILAELII
ncbi:MAG: hypothetical protein PHG66_04050 [Candidatus Colwellbacteria bacterium]|nr:hypothetical protein [Candidatus Colwellbacteria bacterium]